MVSEGTHPRVLAGALCAAYAPAVAKDAWDLKETL